MIRTYVDDDGSTFTYDDGTGDVLGSTPATSGILNAADFAEQARMGPFYQSQSTPWWQQALAGGFTRAIDSHYKMKELDLLGKTGLIGFAGADGRTYPLGWGSYPYSASPQTNGLLLLLIVGGVIWVLAKS